MGDPGWSQTDDRQRWGPLARSAASHTWLAVLCGLWGGPSIGGAEGLVVELQASGPQVAITLPGGGELGLSLGAEQRRSG